jgi:queuine tRNA-ribosyltransferase
MGVGTPVDIIAAVKAGVDMFDCVLPTRNGRNACAFTEDGYVRCDCYCCSNFSRGTIRHFFNVGEMLGPILVSLHNLRFYQRLMARIRQALKNDEFADWATEQLKNDY